MSNLGEQEELLPDEKRYSVVKLDTWKAPGDDDFATKVGEIDALDDGPTTVAGRGESVVILDADGNSVSTTDGPDHPTDTTARGEEGTSRTDDEPAQGDSSPGEETINREDDDRK